MGTHPIFESDFDCLTDFETNSVHTMDKIFEKFNEKRKALVALLKYGQEMQTYESRLKSFENSNWRYSAPSKCVPENLAAAGFFFDPKSESNDSAFDFVTFKEMSFDESDDPWEEQMKRKKGHPLFSRRWGPKMDNFSCLRLADEDLTVHQMVKVAAIAEEGNFQHRINALRDLYDETKDELVDFNQTKNAESPDFSMNETANDDFQATLNAWETPGRDLIRNYQTALTKMKATNQKRFKVNDIKWGGYPDAEIWSQALDEPFLATIQKIEDSKVMNDDSRRISNFAQVTKTAPPSSSKKSKSMRKNPSRSTLNSSSGSIF